MAIEVKKLTKEYARKNGFFKAVSEVHLKVEKGEFVNIIGRSGSGKSTLLNMIAGLLIPTSGKIEIDGSDIFSMKDYEASAFRNSKIGYIPQGSSALSSLTVLDNVRVPYHLRNRGKDSVKPAWIRLKQTGISHLSDVYPKHLSGGELKRVAIARALINNPDYVIADEPTGDLDAETTLEIMKLLKEVAEDGTGVIMVTHELDVLEFGSRTLLMDAGTLSLYPENSRQKDFAASTANVYLKAPDKGNKEEI
jgi:putative ABC transport system ATP-binding protein